MKNIGLIAPLWDWNVKYPFKTITCYPPLGLAYVASYLEKHGFAVSILDRSAVFAQSHFSMNALNIKTVEWIREFQLEIIGVSCCTGEHGDALKVAAMVNRAFPHIPVVFGGPHVSALAPLLLERYPIIDICVSGEGEISMLEICQSKKLEDIRGISFRKDGQIVNNPPRDVHKNIDDFAFPARHLLDMHFYTKRSTHLVPPLFIRGTDVISSRGCPYNCYFCASKVALGKGVRFQSVDLVIKELELLIDRYHIKALSFVDDMFATKKKRVKEICQKIINKGIHKELKWACQLKADIVDKELLQALKEAGCVLVEYGFESGSQKVLDRANKKAHVSFYYSAAELSRKAGILFQANIIAGLPGETVEDAQMTLSFVKKVKPDWLVLSRFKPLPGSIFYNELIDAGRLSVDIWERLFILEENPFNCSAMSDEQYARMLHHLHRHLFFIRSRKFIFNNFKCGIYHPRLIFYGVNRALNPKFKHLLYSIFR
ncbi:hypothetical protein CEE39_04765 [bacterium (candidate division B38) B3_B38]|nr:MAG: hypothetical protein CEE39_04765 [bacterium (candidate division B38) B3_B38]